MKLGYYLCGIYTDCEKDEVELFERLYDQFSHNELTTGEVINEILEFSGIDSADVKSYANEYPEELYGKVFREGDLLLSVCPFGEGYEVYLNEEY